MVVAQRGASCIKIIIIVIIIIIIIIIIIAFCVQKTLRPSARARTLYLLRARRSACCKTSPCPAALSRKISPMRRCTRKG